MSKNVRFIATTDAKVLEAFAGDSSIIMVDGTIAGFDLSKGHLY